MDNSKGETNVSGPIAGNTESEVNTEPESVVDEEDYLQMLVLATATLPLTLKASLDLGVFEILRKGCVPPNGGTQSVMMTADDIVKELPTKNPQAAVMLDRILGLLASFNIVRCSVAEKGNTARRYGPAPIFKWFEQNENGVGATAATFINLWMEEAFFSAGLHLKQAVLEGGTAFEKAHGIPAYEFIRRDPRFSMVFNEAMKYDTTLTMKKMLETYQGFKNVQVLVDVGGCTGASLSMIVAKYPNIKGINLDLPDTIFNSPPLPGVEHVAGDMFDCIPPGDAILLKWILHNWSDEHCVKILKNCYKALPREGKVIVVDFLLPVTPQATTRSQSTFILDVMMLMKHGDKERTKQEFETLGKQAGFTKMEVQNAWGDRWIFEFKK